jgi:hypothetical protein
MTLESRIKHESLTGGLEIHNTEVATEEALFIRECIGRWGMVAGMPNGEDSAGRQQLRLATEEELVERAVKITELMFAAIRQKGYVLSVPTLAEIEAESKAYWKAKEDRAEAKITAKNADQAAKLAERQVEKVEMMKKARKDVLEDITKILLEDMGSTPAEQASPETAEEDEGEHPGGYN